MASLERMLNVKIILTGNLKDVLEWGITEDDYQLKEEKQVFKRLCEDYASPSHPGSVMGPDLAKHVFPLIELVDPNPSTTIEHICTQLRNERITRTIAEGGTRIVEQTGIDPAMAYAMVGELQTTLRDLEPGRTTDVSFRKGIDKVIQRYQKIKSGDSVGKFPWPWKPLQDNTFGVQEDDYIVFYGRPKSMKTWVLVYLIAWCVMFGSRVLFYTKEMTDLNLYMRMAACILQIVYDELRLGRMTPEKEMELMQLRDTADEIEADKSVICLSAKDAGGRDTVSWLRGKVDKYKPDVVFIDGIYLMSVGGKGTKLKDNERVQAISREIRDMILHTRVPVIATIQANRQAAGHTEANLDEIAFSDALSQDCTMAIRVIKDKDSKPNTISLVMGGLREFDMAGLKIMGVPCVDFSFHSLLDQKEVEQVKKQDDEEEQGKKDGNGKGNGKGKKGKATTPSDETKKKAEAKAEKDRQKHMANLPR